MGKRAFFFVPTFPVSFRTRRPVWKFGGSVVSEYPSAADAFRTRCVPRPTNVGVVVSGKRVNGRSVGSECSLWGKYPSPTDAYRACVRPLESRRREFRMRSSQVRPNSVAKVDLVGVIYSFRGSIPTCSIQAKCRGGGWGLLCFPRVELPVGQRGSRARLMGERMREHVCVRLGGRLGRFLWGNIRVGPIELDLFSRREDLVDGFRVLANREPRASEDSSRRGKYPKSRWCAFADENPIASKRIPGNSQRAVWTRRARPNSYSTS